MDHIKAVLSKDALLFLDTECMSEEREAFFLALSFVQEDPLEYSRLYLGPARAKYTLRCFRFGGCVAYFHYFITGERETDLIRVLTCRRVPHPDAGRGRRNRRTDKD